MDKDFVLAATFAAAVHGALLFGFPHKLPVAPVAAAPKPTPREFVTPPQEIELRAVEETYTQAPIARETPPPPVATLPDSPTIDPAIKFTQPVAPPQPFDPNAVTRIIPEAISIRSSDGRIGIGGVVPSGLLDKSPRTRLQPSPIYPHAAKAQGLNGEVIVEFMVDESGRVHDPRVVSSSDRVFEENALRAVAKWVFEPGTRNAQVVRFRMSVPIVFKLND